MLITLNEYKGLSAAEKRAYTTAHGSEYAPELTTFVCRPTGLDINSKPLLCFAQSVPDNVEIGKTTMATCVATQADFDACESKQYEIKNTTNESLKGRFVTSYNLPFMVDIVVDGNPMQVRKTINCNDREVVANVSYKVVKIEEIDKKTNRVYPKFALL